MNKVVVKATRSDGVEVDLRKLTPLATDIPGLFIPDERVEIQVCCPDCLEPLVKTRWELSDGSGWASGYVCGCRYEGPSKSPFALTKEQKEEMLKYPSEFSETDTLVVDSLLKE